ncbi:type IV secretion system protein VirB10 [soil metagenome]
MSTPADMHDALTDDLALASDQSEPIVGRDVRTLNPVVIVAGFAVFAIALFLWLNAHRVARADSLVTVSGQPSQFASPLPPELELAAIPVSNTGGAFSGLPTQVGMPPPLPLPLPPSGAYVPVSGPRTAPSAGDLLARRRAPAMVIDLGGPGERTQLAQATIGAPTPGAAAGAAVGSPQGPQLNESEEFAERVGDQAPERARATTLRNLSALAPQGTIIPGVLETAINSDLPGFTRAVVSRDVLSFDGKAVLIPRGSRLIGQYKSAVALGQSRAFIIWTRVIRPDGVSIQIASPGTDALGRGGLEGNVDRHFFRRFSGSILLSVLSAGVASLGDTPSTQISIGSPGAAAGLASSAVQGEKISPTIKVPQGEAIRIFVSRDLDFSGVDPIR